MLETILKEKNMTMYQCAKLSGIPYTTLSEVVRGKTRIEKCSAETVYKLSKTLHVSMEELMELSVEERLDFEVFKSNVCHLAKEYGQLDFIIHVLQEDEIGHYWNKKWYPEAFYLLAMVDYFCRLHSIPLCDKYDDIRKRTLEKPLYPRDVLMAAKLDSHHDICEQCRREAIPEFLRFNIMENEVGNVY